MVDERLERTIESLEDTAGVLKSLLQDKSGQTDDSKLASKEEMDHLRRELAFLRAENEKLHVRVAILCRALDERDAKSSRT